ncbi:UNVERIFIED_CONTAM: hypothetical protein GTU68_015116 [Idotea baltica]|nr:hypothetical protein [Idotea baltica]
MKKKKVGLKTVLNQELNGKMYRRTGCVRNVVSLKQSLIWWSSKLLSNSMTM